MQYTNLPIIQIGKNGIEKEHIIKALKDHGMIKIKFLKKEFMTEELPGKIIQKIGRTIILKKK
jgi:RNA-binding protein YhbY